MKNIKFEDEYKRIKELFSDVEEKQKIFLDDVIISYVKIKIELNELESIRDQSGSIKIHPQDPSKQKELPVTKQLAKVRPNYLSYHSYLLKILGNNTIDEDDDDLMDFE